MKYQKHVPKYRYIRIRYRVLKQGCSFDDCVRADLKIVKASPNIAKVKEVSEELIMTLRIK